MRPSLQGNFLDDRSIWCIISVTYDQLMLKLSLPSETSEVASAFCLLLNSWRAKVWRLQKIFNCFGSSLCYQFKQKQVSESKEFLSSPVRNEFSSPFLF